MTGRHEVFPVRLVTFISRSPAVHFRTVSAHRPLATIGGPATIRDVRADGPKAKATLLALMIVMTVITTSRPAAASCESGNALSPSVALRSPGGAGQALPTSVLGEGRTLPFTGAPVSSGIAVGCALVVVGVALLTATRPRRRTRRGSGRVALATALTAFAFVIGAAPAASALPRDCGLGAEPEAFGDTAPDPLLPEAPIAVLLPASALFSVAVVRWRATRLLARA